MENNPLWSEKMLRPPSPYENEGLYFQRNFFDKHYGKGIKRWIKIVDTKNKLQYRAESIFYI